MLFIVLQHGIFLVVYNRNTPMKSLRIFLVLISLYAFLPAGQIGANAQNTPPITVSENAGFMIELGKCQKIDGVKITFLEVLEDSRCPKDVNCVWAGQARIKIRIKEKGKVATEQEVLFDALGKEIVIHASETSVIRAIRLSSYPITSTPKRDRVYALEVRI